jgi:hypothetical protein
MKKIAVVIQGPLISFGQGPNNNSNGFDVRETVKENVRQISARGFPYTVATWSPINQREHDILSMMQVEGVEVNVMPIPTISDPDHRFKHHYGIAQAANILPGDFIIKIRTDMLMPPAFWDWIINAIDDRLIVSELISPLYLGDFVYAGSRSTVLEFLNTIIEYQGSDIHPSITSDTGLKYLIHKRNFTLDKSLLRFYVFNKVELTTAWNGLIENCINVIPVELWREIKWRGKPMNSILNVDAFKFDASPSQKLPDTRFLLDEYMRYFTKRQNKKLLIATKLAIWLHRKGRRVSRISSKLTFSRSRNLAN